MRSPTIAAATCSADLQTGTYTITVSAPSFRTVVQERVAVNANTVVRMTPASRSARWPRPSRFSAEAAVLQRPRRRKRAA